MNVYVILSEDHVGDGEYASTRVSVYKVVKSEQTAIDFCAKMNKDRTPYSSEFSYECHELEDD